MNNPLATYLHDHLAGATHAIEIVETIREQYAGGPLGTFAAVLVDEIKADQTVLQEIASRVGSGSSGFKEMSAWLAEKIARLKLSRGAANSLGTFEALEFLELGVHGKWALWRALAVIAPSDPRLPKLDFDYLEARAESQRGSIEEQRLNIARAALESTA
jgi:hypothetical protein